MTSERTGGWSARVARRLPVALMESPFECFTALLGGLLGAFLLRGIFTPASLFEVLPVFAVIGYGVAAIVAAATLTYGLAHRPSVLAVVAGLRLMGTLIVVYAAALLAVGGIAASGFAALFFGGVGALAFFRAFYLSVQSAEAHRLHREA